MENIDTELIVLIRPRLRDKGTGRMSTMIKGRMG